MLSQVTHGVAGFPLAGEEHLIGFLKVLRIVRQYRFHTHPLEGMDNGVYISCIVLDYGNIHSFLRFLGCKGTFFCSIIDGFPIRF